MTRRDLFRGLFALPAATVLAPLAKLFEAVPHASMPTVHNTRRVAFIGANAASMFAGRFERGFVQHLQRGPFPDSFVHPERYGTIVVQKYPNPTQRVRIENGPIVWEVAE